MTTKFTTFLITYTPEKAHIKSLIRKPHYLRSLSLLIDVNFIKKTVNFLIKPKFNQLKWKTQGRKSFNSLFFM